MLVVIAEASNPVLTPTICAAPRVIVRQVIPRGAAGAVILADGAPLPLGHTRSPLPPASLARFVVGQALSFGGRVRRRFGGWSLWHVRLSSSGFGRGCDRRFGPACRGGSLFRLGYRRRPERRQIGRGPWRKQGQGGCSGGGS